MLRHIPDFPVAGRPLRKLDGPMKKDAMNAEKHDLSVCAFYFGAILNQSPRMDASYFSRIFMDSGLARGPEKNGLDSSII